ncbi:SAP domain-containing protein [Zostera marina]|uniref:SAP domain-containing protein n=1 Tax=Zostera marina TaxID=29655 RepID=A0A0K9PNC7_ZOSMR|nr:SAP domain-containing protein [Zostera marina]
MEGPSNSLAGFPSRGFFTSTTLPSSILGDGMRPYLSQHDTSPPEDQIIETNPENILIRALQLSKQKNELKPKAVNGNIRNKRLADKAIERRSPAKRTNKSVDPGMSSISVPDRELESYTVERLRVFLKEKGLSTRGKKDELISRLRSGNDHNH